MIRALVLLTLVTIGTASAAESRWQITGSPETPPFVLVHAFAPDPKTRGYFLDCSGKERIQVTQTGVTKLPAGEPPLMSLSIDEVPPNLVVATSVENPAGGSDLTIWVKKTDPSFLGLPKASLMTIFSTGHTIGVVLNNDDRVILADFVHRCVAMDAR